LQLWQKYTVLDVELIDKLLRISSAANIHSVVKKNIVSNDKSITNNNKEDVNENLSKQKQLEYLQEKLRKQQHSSEASSSLIENFSNSNFKLDNLILSEIKKLTSKMLVNKNDNSVDTSNNKIRDDFNNSTSQSNTIQNEINKVLQNLNYL
jgi:hypothetical protein